MNMTDHYYSESPHSELHKKTWNFELNKNRYTFTSGTGVFSKDKIDFGTELLLQTFHPPPIQGNYLDLGCGYGPIGIVLASQERNRHVVMVDINERAIGFSKENIKLNKIENATVIKSDGLSNL